MAPPALPQEPAVLQTRAQIQPTHYVSQPGHWDTKAMLVQCHAQSKLREFPAESRDLYLLFLQLRNVLAQKKGQSAV